MGPYALTKARGRGSNFALRGELALELAYNLREAGVITNADLTEVEEAARDRVEWWLLAREVIVSDGVAELAERGRWLAAVGLKAMGSYIKRALGSTPI